MAAGCQRNRWRSRRQRAQWTALHPLSAVPALAPLELAAAAEGAQSCADGGQDGAAGACSAPWSAPSAFAEEVGPACRAEIQAAAAWGDLHGARRGALAVLRRHGASGEAARSCSAAWHAIIDPLLLNGSYLDAVRAAHARQGGPERRLHWVARCWRVAGGTAGVQEHWRRCCANAHGDEGSPACFRDSPGWTFETCCTFADGSDSYLAIPALQEVEVLLRLPSGRLLRLAQDGFLRAFDTPTVLWPAGFLLAQWVASARWCPRWAGSRVLELGAGVGAPSIAAAACGAEVLATDQVQRSLALTAGNAALNGATVRTQIFDWHNDADLARALAAGPFDLILAAALRFEEWWPQLWRVLTVLARGRKALLALAHTAATVAPAAAGPPAGFELVARVSGEQHGMGRPDRGLDCEDSDFEVVLLRPAGAASGS